MTYPLGEHKREAIRSKTGKPLSEISMANIMAGKISADDIKISRETLVMQAEVAKSQNRLSLAENFLRAAELVDLPDGVILDIYNSLRPRRSTKAEIMGISQRLRDEYHAPKNAELVAQAAEIYEKRGVLRPE